MALIQCRECKQEIADQASACPHCGAPNQPVASPPPPPPAPAPRFIVDNVDANETCTVLGEYCIRVRCAITNAGSAPGVIQVAAELNEDSVSIGTRRGTRNLDLGQQDTLTFDFPEANLGKQHSFRCYEAP